MSPGVLVLFDPAVLGRLELGGAAETREMRICFAGECHVEILTNTSTLTRISSFLLHFGLGVRTTSHCIQNIEGLTRIRHSDRLDSTDMSEDSRGEYKLCDVV